MFGKLKEKLKGFFKKTEEKAEEKIEKDLKKEEKVETTMDKLEGQIQEAEVKVKEIKQEKEIEKLKGKKKKENIEKQGQRLEEIEKKAEKKEKLDEKKETEKKSIFTKIKSKFKFKITEEYFEEIFSELEFALLENNVALEVVEKIKSDLKTELIGIEIEKNKVEQEIKKALKISIESLFPESLNILEKIKSKKEPYVVLFFGINGSGKTTSLAKLTSLLLKNNISCILAASDTFRAASIEQLEFHGKKLNVKVIKSQYKADPASVAFDAITHAKKHNIKVVLIDTAGRMYTKQDLMKEMEKITRVSEPDLKIFVAEAITGNDAVTQAQQFNDAIGIDGIILTKSDVDEKGGSIISVSYVTGKPILYLGTGQNYKDLQKFDENKILKALGFE